MTHAVQVPAISNDTDVRNIIHTSLKEDGYKVISISSSLEEPQLLYRGLVASFPLIPAPKSNSAASLFPPAQIWCSPCL
jgi:hypothetical protein